MIQKESRSRENNLGLVFPLTKVPTDRSPKSWDLLRELFRDRAVEMFRAGHYEPFRRWLKEASRRWDESPTASVLYGLSFLYQRQFQKARVLLEKAEILWDDVFEHEELPPREEALLMTATAANQVFLSRMEGDLARAREVLDAYVEKILPSHQQLSDALLPAAERLWFRKIVLAWVSEDTDAMKATLRLIVERHPSWREARDMWHRISLSSECASIPNMKIWTDEILPLLSPNVRECIRGSWLSPKEGGAKARARNDEQNTSSTGAVT